MDREMRLAKDVGMTQQYTCIKCRELTTNTNSVCRRCMGEMQVQGELARKAAVKHGAESPQDGRSFSILWEIMEVANE